MRHRTPTTLRRLAFEGDPRLFLLLRVVVVDEDGDKGKRFLHAATKGFGRVGAARAGALAVIPWKGGEQSGNGVTVQGRSP